jgi:acetyl esterase/lipase
MLAVLSSLRAEPGRYQSVVFEKVAVQRDVVFHTATNVKGVAEALKLDVYQPEGDRERGRPAILWLHGGGFRPPNDKQQKYIVTADQSVPFSQSEALVSKLKAVGVRHELLALPNAPHTPTMHMEAIVKTTAAFVFAELKK